MWTIRVIALYTRQDDSLTASLTTHIGETITFNPTIYISAFRDVKDNGSKGFYGDLNETVNWSEFIELLDEYRQVRFTHKEAAPLFAPTVFVDGRRSAGTT